MSLFWYSEEVTEEPARSPENQNNQCSWNSQVVIGGRVTQRLNGACLEKAGSCQEQNQLWLVGRLLTYADVV
jgi:hypothetical protein